jgi:hypothetical protein
MLTTIFLLAAIAATVPDEVAMDTAPDVVEAEVTVTAADAENSSTVEDSADTDPRDQPVRSELAPVSSTARTNTSPQASISLTTKAAPIDREVPVITIVLPTTATITDTVGAVVTISGTVTDDVGLSSVRWTLTGATSANGPFLTTGTWTHTFPSLGVGTYTFKVTAIDTAGKPAVAKTKTITITRAATPPPTTPPPADDGKPETSGDIHSQKCGAGAGLATMLLLCGVVGLRSGRRRIE